MPLSRAKRTKSQTIREVIRESQLVDDAQFAVEAGRHLLRKPAVDATVRPIGVTRLQPGKAKLVKIIFSGFAFRRPIDGKMPYPKLQLDVNAVGDFLRAAQDVVHARKRRVHLLGAAKKELVGVHPHPIRVGAELAGVDAQQDVLGLGVLAVDVVNVAGGHHRDVEPLGNPARALDDDSLHLEAVVLNFKEIIVAEKLAIPSGDFDGFLEIRLAAGQQRAAQFARSAAAQTDQSLAVGGQQLLVDARLEIKTLQKSCRRKFHEVAKALGVASQQRQMINGFFRAGRLFVKTASGGDIGFQTQNGVNPQFLSRLIEFQRTVEISMVGQGQGVHLQGFRPFEQAANRAGPIQKTVMAVAVQMGKRQRAHRDPPCKVPCRRHDFISSDALTVAPPLYRIVKNNLLGVLGRGRQS